MSANRIEFLLDFAKLWECDSPCRFGSNRAWTEKRCEDAPHSQSASRETCTDSRQFACFAGRKSSQAATILAYSSMDTGWGRLPARSGAVLKYRLPSSALSSGIRVPASRRNRMPRRRMLAPARKGASVSRSCAECSHTCIFPRTMSGDRKSYWRRCCRSPGSGIPRSALP